MIYFFKTTYDNFWRLVEDIYINSEMVKYVIFGGICLVIIGVLGYILSTLVQKVIGMILKIKKLIIKMTAKEKNYLKYSTLNKFTVMPILTEEDMISTVHNLFNMHEYKRFLYLIKSGMLLCLKPKYQEKFINCYYSFCNKKASDYAKRCNNVDIKLKEVFISESISYISLTLENISEKEIEFFIAKETNWLSIHLWMKGGEEYELRIQEGMDTLKNARIGVNERIDLHMYGELLKKKTIRNVDKISINGDLKFKGSREKYPFEITVEGEGHKSDKELIQLLSNLYDQTYLLFLLRNGGFMFISSIFNILSVFLCICLHSIVIKIGIIIMDFIVLFMLNRCNKILVQYIYERKENILTEYTDVHTSSTPQ